MTIMQKEAKASVPGIMYIRGVPFPCPGSGTKQARGEPAAAVKQALARPVTPVSVSAAAVGSAHGACSPAGSCPANLLARCGTAGGIRAGISLAESQAQARLMKSRRAVRVFADRAVPMRLLRGLVGTVSLPGPDGRTGLARFIMVEAAPTMSRVAQLAAAWLRREGILGDGAGPDEEARKVVFGGAPHMAVLYGASGCAEAAEACSLAVARLEWAGAAMGLGTCFAGEMVRAAAGSPELAAALSIPAGHSAYAALFIGYPGFASHQPETTPGVRIIWL